MLPFSYRSSSMTPIMSVPPSWGAALVNCIFLVSHSGSQFHTFICTAVPLKILWRRACLVPTRNSLEFMFSLLYLGGSPLVPLEVSSLNFLAGFSRDFSNLPLASGWIHCVFFREFCRLFLGRRRVVTVTLWFFSIHIRVNYIDIFTFLFTWRAVEIKT